VKKYLPWLALSYAVMIPLFGVLWPRTIWRLIRGEDLVQIDYDLPVPEMTDEDVETWIHNFRVNMTKPDQVAADWLEESRRFLEDQGWYRRGSES
jgi:hypothetical protein